MYNDTKFIHFKKSLVLNKWSILRVVRNLFSLNMLECSSNPNDLHHLFIPASVIRVTSLGIVPSPGSAPAQKWSPNRPENSLQTFPLAHSCFLCVCVCFTTWLMAFCVFCCLTSTLPCSLRSMLTCCSHLSVLPKQRCVLTRWLLTWSFSYSTGICWTTFLWESLCWPLCLECQPPLPHGASSL